MTADRVLYPIGASIVSADRVFYPIGTSIMTADRVQFPIGTSIVTADRVLYPIGKSILSRVRVLYSIGASIVTADRMLYPNAEVLCRPSECYFQSRKHPVGRQSTIFGERLFMSQVDMTNDTKNEWTATKNECIYFDDSKKLLSLPQITVKTQHFKRRIL